MLCTIIKPLEICSDINFEISEADRYTRIFTLYLHASRIFRLALEIPFFYLTSNFSDKWLASYSHKVENVKNEWEGWGEGGGRKGASNNSMGGRLENFLKKNKRGDAY